MKPSNNSDYIDEAHFYICLNCGHKMRRSSFYDGAVHTPCDKCGQTHIEHYPAIQNYISQQCNAARMNELEKVINEYNFMQEEVEQPTKALKIGNSYVLDRLKELSAAASPPQENRGGDKAYEDG